MIAPMMTKIQRAIPASFMLTDLANAGVEMRLKNPAIKKMGKTLNIFSTPTPPFNSISLKYCIPYANVKPLFFFVLII
jgi:hypothetical protein